MVMKGTFVRRISLSRITVEISPHYTRNEPMSEIGQQGRATLVTTLADNSAQWKFSTSIMSPPASSTSPIKTVRPSGETAKPAPPPAGLSSWRTV